MIMALISKSFQDYFAVIKGICTSTTLFSHHFNNKRQSRSSAVNLSYTTPY